MAPQPSLNGPDIAARLEQNSNITNDELHALRRQLDTFKPDERAKISASLDAFEQRSTTRLSEDAGTRDALSELRTAINQPPQAPLTPVEQFGSDAGATIGKTLETTGQRAAAIGYKQFTDFMNPNRELTGKILQVSGILLLGYGMYRLAKWAKGKPTDSIWGKVLKFTGLAALAGVAINVLGARAEAAQSPSASSTSPTPAISTAPSTPVPGLDIDDPSLATKGNLLENPVTLNVDGTNASIERLPSGEPVVKVGAQSYSILKGSMPVGPLLSSVTYDKNEYQLTANLFWKEWKGSITSEQLRSIVRTLRDSPNALTKIPVSYFNARHEAQTVNLTFSKI